MWIVATVIVLVLCTAWHNATGIWRGLEVGGEPFWRTPWRLEIVFAVILGYVFACGGWIVRSVRRDLDALAPALAIEPSELAAERAGIGLFSPSALLVAGVGGVAAGIAVNSLVNAILPPGHAALEDRFWRFVRDVTIWTLSIRLIVVVIGSSQRVSQLSERVARIDLLDLRGLAPLARIGLRSALAFALAASMIAAMAGDELHASRDSRHDGDRGRRGSVHAPAARARRASRDPRREGRRAARGARGDRARAHRGARRRGSEAAEDAMRLGGLLAFEARIAGVGEWPFDVGTFVRFAAVPRAAARILDRGCARGVGGLARAGLTRGAVSQREEPETRESALRSPRSARGAHPVDRNVRTGSRCAV